MANYARTDKLPSLFNLIPKDTFGLAMSLAENQKLVIIGLNQQGDKFRPSDWAERLCGGLCTFRNRRMYYSPLLRPAVIDGVKCVIVDSKLALEQSEMYQYVLNFVEENQLKTELQSR